MNAEAQRRIDREREEQTGKLTLNECGLESIPKQLFKMTHLVELNLLGNQIGNHSSGKSTLLEYLLTDEIKEQDSTHGLKIEYLDDPKAVFFDFGGQDYYHGMYKPYLSQDAFYLILWKHSTNKNERIPIDVNGFACHHFQLSYWLAQKRYLENEIYSYGNDQVDDPKFVIQTHAGEDDGDEPKLQIKSSEKKSINLVKGKEDECKSLKNSITNKISSILLEEKYQKQEPQWYIDFVEYLIEEGNDNTQFRKLDDLLQGDLPIYNAKQEDKFISLKAELQLLHRRGIVLYYPEINDQVYWPGPASFAEFVRINILKKEYLVQHNSGNISEDELQEFKLFLDIMIDQKVIFHDIRKRKYIIPGYLAPKDPEDQIYLSIIDKVDQTVFFLQFKEFLPFGFINQLIHSIGQEGKFLNYWRDELIFEFIGDKFRLEFDYINLRLSLYTNNSKLELSKKQYMFCMLLSEYWGIEYFNYYDFYDYINGCFVISELSGSDPRCQPAVNFYNMFEKLKYVPDDLYISFNKSLYVKYTSILECREDKITAYPLINNIMNLSQTVTCDFLPFFELVKFKNMNTKISHPSTSIMIDKVDNQGEVISVFIVYSWDNEGHKDRALSFCDHLRKNGYNAEIDRLKSQQETSTDFSKMMHLGMTNYDKVIIILSEGYKKKADTFTGGVGEEYQMIIKDIQKNSNKYVLYTFDKSVNDIAPLALLSREIISYFDDKDFQRLYSKLNNEELVKFSPVSVSRQKVVSKEIQDFTDIMNED